MWVMSLLALVHCSSPGLSVTDACGNSIAVVQTITVDDNTPPTATAPPAVSVECVAAVPPADINLITDEADNCVGPITVAHVGDVSSGTCPLLITRTYSVTDACGNSIAVVQTITVDDNTPPTATAPPAVSVECVAAVPPADINLITDEADNCVGPITVAHVGDVSSGTCPLLITRTYSVTDACGNSIAVVQTITVDDNTPPTATAPPAVSVECVAAVPPADINLITDEADNCVGPITVAHVGDVSSGTCPLLITRTYSVTDACGNSIAVVQTITVDDNTPPTATAPPAVSVECVAAVPPADINLITDEADNCVGPITVAHVGDVSSGTCPLLITRTYSVTDACGNSIAVVQTITVDDNTPPTATAPPAVSVECVAAVPPADINLITDEADNCVGPITVAHVGDVSSGTCPLLITRTYSVTDACGNSIAVVQTITVDDNTPPTATAPPAVSVECVAAVPPADINSITDEADNCVGPITVAHVGDVSSGTCPLTITRTYSVTDACGNSIAVVQTITVDDITPPTATAPAPVTVECVAAVPPADINAITDEADNCVGPITVAHVGDVSAGTCPLIITRTYSVTDACGNSIAVVQTITVDDNTLPTATAPAPVSVECIAAVPAADINIITDEADNCVGPITVAHVGDVSAGTCPLIITRTYSVTDACGNSIAVVQTITVDDNTLPTATAPAPVSVECIAAVPAADINIITDEADNCVGPITVAHVGDVSAGTCPLIITRTYSVTDACGNSIAVVQTITVDDNTLPTATAPAPVTVECIAAVAAADINIITDEADNCVGPITVAHVGDVSSGTCPMTITRTYSVTDACGNSIAVVQTITVDDNTLPTATAPAPVTVECIAAVAAADINIITDEADNCVGPITVAHVGDVSSGTCPMTITRTYSVTDACGNSIAVVQTITVDDNTLPTATAPAPVTVECIAAVAAADINIITDEADNCVGPITVAHVGDVSSGTCPMTITRTYSVTDACGNSIAVVQTITVDDNTLPTATAPAPVTVECIAAVPAADINIITDEADNCVGPITVAHVGDVSAGTCPLIITRTYSVTDACGNSIAVVQTITVDDNTLPTATTPAPVTVECIAAVPAADINIITDEADNCVGPITVAHVGDVSSGTCPMTITRTYSVTDACGNSIAVVQTITVDDNTLPTATAPAPVSVECIAAVPAADINIITDEADNCVGPITVAHVGDVSAGTCPLIITRTYSVTDACGNSIAVVQT